MSKHHYTYLALGDSYTIGESVALYESFPYQTVQLLRKSEHPFQAAEIIAATGWTSTELAKQILHTQLNESYDFVTLLVGVNNQYRGLSIEEFKTDFEFLVHKAVHLSGKKPEHVIVLSIPDWGLTPFAAKKDSKKISEEINAFNQVCESVAQKYQTQFITITDETRKAKKDLSLLTHDHLHYSGKEHAIWAKKIAALIEANL